MVMVLRLPFIVVVIIVSRTIRSWLISSEANSKLNSNMPKRIPSFDDVVNPLNEGFLNLSTEHTDKKKEMVDQVWDMLQKSYEKVGGMIGHGFESKEDMIK